MSTPTLSTTVAIASFAVLFQVAAPSAQAPEPPRLTAGIAGGVAAPFHADLGFTAPEWQVAVRMRVSRHVAMEIFMDQWRHAEGTVATDVPLQGVSGLLGRPQEIRTRTVRTTRVIGWNTLVQGGPGRLTFFGGGGPGYMTFDRRYTLTMSGCTPEGVRVCAADESSYSGGSFAAQVLGGAEVAISSRIAVFGQLQLAVPARDPGSSHASTTGGIRVRVW